MRWKLYGPSSVLITFADRIGDDAFDVCRAIATDLEANPPPGLVEYVPAFTTILVEFDPTQHERMNVLAADLVARFERLTIAAAPPAPIKEIPVRYDGEDLDAVAAARGLTTGEVIDLHSRPIYKVYLLGFSPGFPYLGDLDQRLHTPRLATPRVCVAAGSVAIGGEHTGIYSVDGPGGWSIIGHTSVPMFVPRRGGSADGMFFLRAGDQVRFVPVIG